MQQNTKTKLALYVSAYDRWGNTPVGGCAWVGGCFAGLPVGICLCGTNTAGPISSGE